MLTLGSQLHKQSATKAFLAIAALIAFAPGCLSASGASEKSEAPFALPDSAQPGEAETTIGYSLRFAVPSGRTIDPASEVGRELLIQRQLIEARYNVRIRTVDLPASQIVPRLTSSVLSGDPFADVVELDVNDAIPALVEQNLLLPLDEYFAFDKPPWNHPVASSAHYGGATYGYVSAPIQARGLWYNRELLASLGLPDPQELLAAGIWSWNRFLSIGRAVAASGGDGARFALALAEETTDAWLWSNGARVVNEQDGRMSFALGSAAAIEALEFVSLLWREGLALQGDAIGSFIAGRAAFLAGPPELGPQLVGRIGGALGWVYYPNGPRGRPRSVVTSSLPISSFPTGLRFPPERLAEICTELADAEVAALLRRSRLEQLMPDGRSLAIALEMGPLLTVDRTAAFPGLRRLVVQMIEAVKRGEPPRSVVAELHDAAVEAVTNR